MSSRSRSSAPPPAAVAPLATIDLGILDRVIGGAGNGDALSAMLPMMLMMRGRGHAAAAPPPPAPAPTWKPKIVIDGVEQNLNAPAAPTISIDQNVIG
jgi:hypothetical protein